MWKLGALLIGLGVVGIAYDHRKRRDAFGAGAKAEKDRFKAAADKLAAEEQIRSTIRKEERLKLKAELRRNRRERDDEDDDPVPPAKPPAGTPPATGAQ